MSDLADLLGFEVPSAASPPASLPVPAGAGGVMPRVRDVITVSQPKEMAYGAFEAADQFDNALALWGPMIRSADADILPDKEQVDARARDLIRNDAYIQGGSNLHKDNIVGAHYLLNSRPTTRKLFGKDDDIWEEEFQTEVEELWELYAESPDCWIDAQRTNSFTALVRLAVGVHVAAGEMLATAEWDRTRGGEFATQIQMIDLDRLTDPQFISFQDRQNIRRGIKFDAMGAPVSYFIRTAHPYDFVSALTMPEWKEIPIRRPWGRLQVIHIHEQQRPDQSRGIAELAAAMKASRIGHRLRDLTLQRVATQALYAAAITSELPAETVFAQLGGNTSDEAVGGAITNFATGYLNAISKYASGSKNLHVDGVKIPHLFPGTKLDMLSPGKDTVSGTEFEQSLLRYIAASLGVSYEQLSRDYTNTNYSSARAAMTETWKFMQSRKKLVADRFAHLVFRLWLEEAINNNKLSTFPAKKAPLLYTNKRLNLNFDALTKCDWIGASRGQIDELKETQAAIARIDAGISTAEDELARLGKDWRKVYRQLKREKALRDQLGLVFVSGQNSVVAGVNSSDPANDPTPKQERKAA